MTNEPPQRLSDEEEQSLEQTITELLELPMFVLAMVMLILLVLEFTVDLSPELRRTFALAGTVIWWIFILEYALRIFLAENRLRYIRKHWIDGLFIIVPFLRVLRVLRVVRTVRLLRVMNPATLGRTYVTTRRGLRQLANVLGKTSFVYVVATTLVVLFVGSLMIFLLERGAPGSVILTYGTALWWTIGALTTVGTEIYPVTAEGRVVAVVLMIYGVGVFGYIAATLASYFVSSHVGEETAPLVSGEEPRDLEDKIDRLLAILEEREKRDSDQDNAA